MYKSILAAIDLEHGEHTQQILALAKRLADTFEAEVCLINVVPAGPAIVSQFLDESFEGLASGEAQAKLTELAADLASANVKSSSLVRFGTVYEEILAAAEKVGADLIIVGSQKPGATAYLLGTNAARVVRHATCSVIVVR
ncbi:MAG: universal stress protein [Methyloligellaceae bacterium]